jgi:hypothetical protein
MQISYIGTEKDFVDAQRTHAWRKYSHRGAIVRNGMQIVAGSVMIVLGLLTHQGVSIESLIFLIGLGLYLILAHPVVAPLLSKRAYRRRLTDGSHEVFLTLSDDSLTSDCPGKSHTVLEWSMFKGIIESRTTILLYVSSANFLIIPRRALSVEQESELRGLVRRHGVQPGCPKPLRKGDVQ